MVNTHSISTLSLEGAIQFSDAAIAQAQRMNVNIHVHVVDHTGETLSYQRMPGAPLPAGDIAKQKASTAANYKTPTDVWASKVSKKPNVATSLVQHPDIVLIGGGVPIIINEQVVGAIGIAGALEEQDIEIANAAVEKVLG
ncbi:MAG: heme-binding protein [Methylocystaceae bacterium]|nr:heme-binding protein [Methylocystaceae bacterium]